MLCMLIVLTVAWVFRIAMAQEQNGGSHVKP